MKDMRTRMLLIVLVALGLTAAWMSHSWRSDEEQQAGSLQTPLASVPVITLEGERERTATGAGGIGIGVTLTPSLYVIAQDATPITTPSITPTPRPTVDYGMANAMGRIEIPALGTDRVIVPVSWIVKIVDGQAVSQWETVDDAVAHNQGTAPLGGPGNTVLTGHTRGNGQGEFQNLWELESGDEVRVWDAVGDEFVYVVESVDVLQEVGLTLEQRQENARRMLATEDTRLTMITCWPEWVYTHRVIVVARPQGNAQ